MAGASQEILTSLSVLINSRDIIVQLQMVVIRLKELEAKND